MTFMKDFQDGSVVDPEWYCQEPDPDHTLKTWPTK